MSPLSRRAFLGVAGSVVGAVAIGCDGSSPQRPGGAGDPAVPPPEARSEPTGAGSPDVGMIASAVVSHRALQASYRGLTRAHPSTRPDVEVLVDHLGEHLSALGHPVSPTDPPSRTEGNQTRALARLRAAEATAGADRAAASLVAESGDLARVLASVAACHAQHVALLDDLLETGR